MFVISKRNLLVRRADGTSYLVKKDFVGDIPKDIFESSVIQGAIKGGLVATTDSTKDQALYAADAAAAEKEKDADIRPDTARRKKQ